MGVVRACGAVIALSVAMTADAGTDLVPVDVGSFFNIGQGQVAYTGDFATYVSSQSPVLFAPG